MSTNLIQAPPPGLRPGEMAPVPDSPERPDPKPRFAPFDEWLTNVSRKIRHLDHEAEINRLHLIMKMRMYYAGRQVGRINPQTHKWEDRKKPGDALYIDPVLPSFVDVNVSTRMKSRPKVKVSARAEDRVDKTEAARYAEGLYKDAQRQLFGASVRLHESKQLELSGETYCLLYFDPRADGTEVRVPVTERRMVQPQSAAWECPMCETAGELTGELPSPCPSCGFHRTERVGAEPFEAEVITGYEEVPAGDVRALFPDPLSVKVVGSPSGRIADALAVTWDSYVTRGVLEAEYPGIKIGSTGSEAPLGLQYERQLQASSDGESGEKSGGEQFELLHLRRVWLSPVLFAGYKFEKDTKLFGGEVVPAGTSLKDESPTGLYFCHVGSTVLDRYEQPIGECWSHCRNVTGDGFHGLGSWDLIPLQEMVNELVSMQFAAEMYDSLSPTLYRSQYVDPKKIPNKPGAMVPVQNMPDEHALSNAMWRLQPGNHTSNAANLREQIAASMQNRYGSFSANGGAPDVKAAGTATGIAILQEQSVGRMGPSLALQAEVEVERCYQILELRQRHWPEEMYETLDKKVGGDAGRWFRESDVRRDFLVEIVPQSWYPATEAQRRVDFSEYMNLAAVLGATQDPKVSAALLKRGGELYGRGIELEHFQNDRVEGRIRLEKIREVARFLEQESGVEVYGEDGLPDDELVQLALEQSDAPVDDILDRHQQYAAQFGEWLLTSEGRQESDFVRAVVRARIIEHHNARVRQEQHFKALKAGTMLPDKLADLEAKRMDAEQQMEMQAAQEEQRLRVQGAEAEQQAALGLVALEGEALQKDLEAADREHQLETKMIDREHSAAMAQAKQGVTSQG